jgi:hypothetical protein
MVAIATLATMLTVFYTIENWRGKRAFESCRRELAAKGETLDWEAFIPPPVPDDLNFYRAPHMEEWFVRDPLKAGGAKRPGTPSPFQLALRKTPDLVIADVRVIGPSSPPESLQADAELHFAAPGTREEARRLVQERTGACVIGASSSCVLVARPVEQIKPLRVYLGADHALTPKELVEFFSGILLDETTHLRAVPTGSNAFNIVLTGAVYGAADYVAQTEQLRPNFDLLREALKRPYARINCDYQQPFALSSSDVVNIRGVSQVLSQRAQCFLLLGQAENAWRDLSLIHDVVGIVTRKPAGKPIMLIDAMIYNVVCGTEANLIESGLRLHAWQEPQLRALQAQLEATDVLSLVVAAFRSHWAATCRIYETTSPGELAKMDRMLGRWIPHGWLYQSLVAGAPFEQELLATVDATNRLVWPSRIAELTRKVSARSIQSSLYASISTRAITNQTKAVKAMARNQTQANLALVACALERYRLAQGQYPEKLDVMAPRFISKVPRDLIGGQPLKYHRGIGEGYILYSIGWDERDGGGTVSSSPDEGDWIWAMP